MKRNFLLIALAFISINSFAQTSFGIRGGVSNATLNGDAVNSLQGLLDFSNGAVSASRRTGFFAGGYATIPIAQNFSIEPGLYYTQKGYQLGGSFSVKGAEFLSAGATARLNTTYIDLPLLAKADFNGLQVFAGPQLSYLADAKLRTTAGALGFNILDQTIDAKNQFNQWDVALTGGVGYQFANGFNIRAAYDHGLMKVDNGRNLESYNRVLKLGIGIRL